MTQYIFNKQGFSFPSYPNPNDLRSVGSVVQQLVSIVTDIINAIQVDPNTHAKLHALDSILDHSIGSLASGYLIKSDGSKLISSTKTDADISSAVDLKFLGSISGINVTIKNTTELYVSGGEIEIAGKVYALQSQISVSLGTMVSDTMYYIYVNAPNSGLILSVTEFSVSTTPPVFSDSLCSSYKNGDNTKRYIARYYNP